MDPVTALGVATSVVQFIHFSASLVSQTKRIYDSAEGTLPEYLACETTGKNLADISTKVKKSITDLVGSCHQVKLPEDEALEIICNACIEVSDELQTILYVMVLERMIIIEGY